MTLSGLKATDHPRSRGEHEGEPAFINEGAGSSPLARGAQVKSEGVGQYGGIIPARAGSTHSSVSRIL